MRDPHAKGIDIDRAVENAVHALEKVRDVVGLAEDGRGHAAQGADAGRGRALAGQGGHGGHGAHGGIPLLANA